MGCTVDRPHDDCHDITHKFQSLESERDVLKAELEKFKAPHYAVVKLEAEVERLKTLLAKFEGWDQERIDKIRTDRDTWKKLAEGLAEAIRDIKACAMPINVDALCKKALAAFEAVQKGRGA